MATPSATPAAPASTNAPTISSAVAHACTSQGISPDVSARATTAGLGRMYSRMPRCVDATCHSTSTPANSTAEGARAASHARMSGHGDGDGVRAHVRLVHLDAEAGALGQRHPAAARPEPLPEERGLDELGAVELERADVERRGQVE